MIRMKGVFTLAFWTLAVAITANISLLRAFERSSVWTFPELLLHATLVAQVTCLTAWLCHGRLPAAFQAASLICMVILVTWAVNLSDAAQARFWLACLLVQLASTNLAYSTLIKLPSAVSHWWHPPSKRADKNDNRVTGNGNRVTIRKLLSLTTAAGLVFAAMSWTDIDLRMLAITWLFFGCCGLLSAFNIWSSLRFEVSTATTIAILISASGGGMLRVCGLGNHDWLTATLLFVFMQLSICCGILGWRALAPAVGQLGAFIGKAKIKPLDASEW